MVSVTTPVDAVPASPVTTAETPRDRPLGLVPTASMITGAAIGVLWFWIPLTLLIVAVSSIPSVIGFVQAGKVKNSELLSPRFTWMASKETD